MRLVEQGDVDLDAPVRTYVPELRLQRRARRRQGHRAAPAQPHRRLGRRRLHRAPATGDDALARYVELLADVEQVTPLGATVSYNNAALSLAGRVIEKVTGTTYERAIADLLLEPLGMTSTFFFADDVMTRRFAVGHHVGEDGTRSCRDPGRCRAAPTPPVA